MKKFVVIALLAASGSALASPCPKGNNSHLGDTTTASATAQQQAELDRLAAAASTAGNSGTAALSHQGFRTAFPH